MRVAKVIIGDIDALTGGYLYEKKLVEYLRGRGTEADIVSLPNLPYSLLPLCNIWLALRLWARQYDIVIEDEMAHPAVWLYNLWTRCVGRSRVVVIVHMLRSIAYRDSWQRPAIAFMEKATLRSSHMVIANSGHTKRQAENMGVPAEAVKLVYPGFDADLARRRPARESDELRLLFVGNWDPRKGLETLVDAVHRLDHLCLSLDVVGDDAFHPRYARRIRRKVADFGLGSRITLHGRVSREAVGAFYSQADVFVLPSSYEPFGIVFAEAMSFGLPVIAANAGGVPELVEHGVNGLLVPPGDADALASAIAALASDCRLRRRLGEGSHRKSKGLNTWEDCFQAIHDHLTQLVAGQD